MEENEKVMNRGGEPASTIAGPSMSMSRIMKVTGFTWIVSVIAAATAACLMVRCNDATPEADTGAVGKACIADSIRTLHLDSTIPTCSTDDWTCRARCRVGDPASCVGLAYA